MKKLFICGLLFCFSYSFVCAQTKADNSIKGNNVTSACIKISHDTLQEGKWAYFKNLSEAERSTPVFKYSQGALDNSNRDLPGDTIITPTVRYYPAASKKVVK